MDARQKLLLAITNDIVYGPVAADRRIDAYRDQVLREAPANPWAADHAAAVNELIRAYEQVKLELEAEHPGVSPFLMRNLNGGYILVDALTVLVKATGGL